MSKKVEDFFVIFDAVRAAFEKRGLEGDPSSLDVIEKIAVHLNMNINPGARFASAPGTADGQQGTVTGSLESTAKRNVETKMGTRTAFDITVDGQVYGTFDKKLFPPGLAVGDKITVKYVQKGKFRNLVEIIKDEAEEDKNIPF